MISLNFKHLRYFWAVAKFGSIVRASEQLFVTPQSISGQLSELEQSLNVQLFKRVGRGLELTDMGRRVLNYANAIFTLGDELVEALQDNTERKILPFRVGIADSVPKLIAFKLVEPALQLKDQLRLICHEGRLTSLLADLAIHRLDLVIADRSMPNNLNVRAYNHLLGESGLSVFASSSLAITLSKPFPECLHRAPFLLPGEDVTLRPKLIQWFELNNIQPRFVGEFDDSALLKAFGQAGIGLFVAPQVITPYVQAHYDVEVIGQIPEVVEQVFAITTERRLSHPATVAIREAAKNNLFA